MPNCVQHVVALPVRGVFHSRNSKFTRLFVVWQATATLRRQKKLLDASVCKQTFPVVSKFVKIHSKRSNPTNIHRENNCGITNFLFSCCFCLFLVSNFELFRAHERTFAENVDELIDELCTAYSVDCETLCFCVFFFFFNWMRRSVSAPFSGIHCVWRGFHVQFA